MNASCHIFFSSPIAQWNIMRRKWKSKVFFVSVLLNFESRAIFDQHAQSLIVLEPLFGHSRFILVIFVKLIY